MRTCKYHGDSVDSGWYECAAGKPTVGCPQRPPGEEPRCFVPLATTTDPQTLDPATLDDGDLVDTIQTDIDEARPVDLAALLRYHRRETVSSRTDRAWHAEAAEALEGAVEELRLLRAIHEAAVAPRSGPPYWADALGAYRAWKEGR